MKKLFLFVLLTAVILFLVAFFFNATKEKVKHDIASSVPYPSQAPSPTLSAAAVSSDETLSLFIPYWAVKTKLDTATHFDKFIYFGVAPTTTGIDMKEAGAKQLQSFLSEAPNNTKQLLAVRMVDSETNFAILKDSKKQATIIKQSVQLAKDNKFDGIVLDLEVSAIPFDSLINQINVFAKDFYKQAKASDLSFSLAIYGDDFYRARPFDVKTLAKNTDEILIMAYDFSKAKSNPGPNFPLEGSEIFGYDYHKMVDDFLRVVPAKKLTVVFGLFGYDWTVDKAGKATAQAKALTLTQIQAKFLTKCSYKQCVIARDKQAGEQKITYQDETGENHSVWFEDMNSIAAKKQFLKTHGINSFSYWAQSYF